MTSLKPGKSGRGARRGARASRPSLADRPATLAGVRLPYERPIFARQVALAARRRSCQGRRAGEVRAHLEALLGRAWRMVHGAVHHPESAAAVICTMAGVRSETLHCETCLGSVRRVS